MRSDEGKEEEAEDDEERGRILGIMRKFGGRDENRRGTKWKATKERKKKRRMKVK